MKKWTSLVVVGVIIISACSETQTEGKISNKQQKKEQIYADVSANSKLTIDVKGMECVMACGGSITEALQETGAVKSVDFDFKMAREYNTATILFDSTKISSQKIIALIEHLNDDQFSTKNAQLETTDKLTSQNSYPSSEGL